MNQRNNYFISKGMQSKFAGTILLLVFLIAVVTVCNIYVLGYFFVNTQKTMAEADDLTNTLLNFAAEFWPRLILLIFVNVIIVFIVSVMYSHQIAGPAYKLEKSIKRITNGDLNFEVYLRHNDNLKELATALNGFLDKFRGTLATAKSLSEDISARLSTVESDENFKQLAAKATELRELINQFKITSEDGKKETVNEDVEDVEDVVA